MLSLKNFAWEPPLVAIRFTLNGKPRSVSPDPGTPLLWVLSWQPELSA
jgi:aerobic-type carbon monoxide dehydrogenase small subunit (CoxS/CutS family)